MAITDRSRLKSMRAAQKLVPAARLTGYVVGRSGPNPVAVIAAMLGSAALLSAALFALTGTFVFPGVLIIIVVQYLLSPPVGVVVADQGVAVTKRSFWNGRPQHVVALVGHEHVQPQGVSLGRIRLLVGNESVWLSKGEEARLRAAIAQQLTARPSPPLGAPPIAGPPGAGPPGNLPPVNLPPPPP